MIPRHSITNILGKCCKRFSWFIVLLKTLGCRFEQASWSRDRILKHIYTGSYRASSILKTLVFLMCDKHFWKQKWKGKCVFSVHFIICWVVIQLWQLSCYVTPGAGCIIIMITGAGMFLALVNKSVNGWWTDSLKTSTMHSKHAGKQN